MFGTSSGWNATSGYRGRKSSSPARPSMGMYRSMAAGYDQNIPSVKDGIPLSKTPSAYQTGMGGFEHLPVGNGGFGQLMRTEMGGKYEDKYLGGRSSCSEKEGMGYGRGRDNFRSEDCEDYGWRGREGSQAEYRKELVARANLELKPCFIIDQPTNSREQEPLTFFADKEAVDPWGNWQKNKKEEPRVSNNHTITRLHKKRSILEETRGSKRGVLSNRNLKESEDRIKSEQKRLLERKKNEEERLEKLRMREEKLSREEERLKKQEEMRCQEFYAQQEMDHLRREESKIDQMKKERVKREKELFEREKKFQDKDEYFHRARSTSHHSTRVPFQSGGEVYHAGEHISSEHGMILDLLSSYLFKGVIIAVKAGFGFIRSRQVSGEVFVHVEHIDTEGEKLNDMVDRTVFFTLFDSEKKSLEARNVQRIGPSVGRSLMDGRILSWDVDEGKGWLEDRKIGMRLEFDGAEMKLNKRKREKQGLVGRKVTFELYVYSNQTVAVEARNVKLVNDYSFSPGPAQPLPLSPSAEDLRQTHGQESRSHDDKRSVSLYSSEDLVNNNSYSYHSTAKASKTSLLTGQNCRISVSTRLGLKKGFRKTDLHASSRSREERVVHNSQDWDVFTTVDQVGYSEVNEEDDSDV